MKKREITQCLSLQSRAARLIPGMTQLLSKRPDMFSRGVWPGYFKDAHGTEVVDIDNNHYIDCSIGGIGATVLGYADPEVNDAVVSVINSGSASTLNPPEEVALAERLVELHPWADMARFTRSGGEAMAVAVRIARVATKRDTIVFCGYHGWMDWYLAANLGKKDALDEQWIAGLSPNGVPKGLAGTSIPFTFNDIESFNDAIEKAGDNLAAVVMEPIRNFEPTTEFMQTIHHMVRSKNIPLVIDEISSGFRICNGGAHLKLGWEPDIAVFSKALGNGFPIAAVIGKKSVMSAAQDAFITSTNWTERTGPAAALAMINKFIAVNASAHLVAIAGKVEEGWNRIAKKNNIGIHIGGFKPMIHFSFNDDNNVNRAYFTQEMLYRGFLAGSAFYSMYAHTEEQIDKYLEAMSEVFSNLALLMAQNEVSLHLIGQPASVGFARIN